ncbi:CubicO group peptidase (beta-lactamase class C family) [Aquimarina sp. EL_43]|uniref:serine hydrolase n=1 Tax=unclassified Aquimarina TaxID=2627091 RepID=UPI0018C90FDC|nr:MULTISPECIES: serine hydrolase [unclassified Aquimarina]MBG6128907.1 CubicO group peptidase (beta-lactamase class C family) [Aquimarina sp. EL_35]MBG6149971.1 CubicO group peptidase (beta-lactamase class C family) [Aquimarina sp. EL_32]MBG6167342.1 CubicO group peptidase (beta-lactamase class C family) [Aquimarina sp. EL_43]
MKKAFLTLISLIILSGGTTSCAQKTEKDEFIIKKIDNYLNENISNGFSGAVLVAKQGKVILNKGYGLANREDDILYSSNTVATIGSTTKQFTATAILKLVEFNKIKVTDPLRMFFTDLPNDKKNITIHQLLTHTSGLIDVIGKGDFDYIPREQFFKTLFETELIQKPGLKYRYSNAGYSILARIIELVSGQEYEHFLNEYLFKPAGMKQTGYFIPDWDKKMIASGYMKNVIPVGTMIERFHKAGNKVSWTLKGNGGIHSTPEDMYKWYLALKSNTILSKSLTKILTTPYTPEQESRSSHYAYGWAIFNSDRNTKIVSHNGGNHIFFHDFIWLPKEDVVIIFFTNATSREVELAWPIEKMIFNADYQPKPIKKNLSFFILDFIKKNKINQSNVLTTMIKKEYSSDLRNGDALNDMGYMILRQEKNPDWAIELFRLNVQLFSDNGNLWDSLGDGYKKKGDKEEAIKAYQKAYELDPSLAASINSLAELGIKVETKVKKEAVVDHSILKSYIGKYELKPGFVLTVMYKNGKLIVQPTGRDEISMFAESNEKFFLEKINANIRFNKNDDGKVESLTLIESGEEMLANRL